MADAQESDSPGWRCIIDSWQEAGAGKDKHVEYGAQSQACGQQPKALRFRFSDLVRLRAELEAHPDLRNVKLPDLPPKVTFRSTFFGRLDEAFNTERQKLLQEFFDALGLRLGEKYSGIGDCTDLCEPLGAFVRRAAASGSVAARIAERAEVAAEVAAVAAAVRTAEIHEDREIISQQNNEFEESLRIDELRAVEEAERREAERLAALQAEEERNLAALQAEEERKAVQKAEEERAKDLENRRAVFEELNPVPASDIPQANVRIKAPSGATLTRAFASTTPVSVLFEFVVVADWPAAPRRAFDLRMSFPSKSLKDSQEETLDEAGLCPSAALLVAELEDE